MVDPYANQYPSPTMYDPHVHQQHSQSAYGHQQQPDPAYYPQAGPESFQQNPHMVRAGHTPHQNDYYAIPASDQGYHNQQQNTYFPNNDQYYEEPEYAAASPRTPMVQQQQQQQQAYNGPTLAPADEAESYRPKEHRHGHDDDGSGCNCCCYNPAMTCCSCFCMLISIAFLAAGIGLIVASSVIQGKCDVKCGQIPEEYRSETACGTICGKVVHDSLFYSGIGVAALAGLSVVWRLVTWTCTGFSKH